MSKPALAPIAPEDLVAVHGGVQSSDDQLKNAITKIQTDLKDAVTAQKNQPNPLQQMMPVLMAAKLSGRI
ncbi:MAG: hypothetical protein HOV81_20160 [Kofleriaceae bacterium]|nr:hypothetical protein [Kofleriaceae bacterium]